MSKLRNFSCDTANLATLLGVVCGGMYATAFGIYKVTALFGAQMSFTDHVLPLSLLMQAIVGLCYVCFNKHAGQKLEKVLDRLFIFDRFRD